MPDLVIRAHRPADRPFLRRMMELAALPTYPELRALGRISQRERLDAIFEFHYGHEEKAIFVAETGSGEPVGMIWLQTSHHPITELMDCLVINVAVLPDRQHQGIGRRLMTHARDHCAERGIRRMRLFVGARNEAAYALYRQLGFEDQTHEMLWTF